MLEGFYTSLVELKASMSVLVIANLQPGAPASKQGCLSTFYRTSLFHISIINKAAAAASSMFAQTQREAEC